MFRSSMPGRRPARAALLSFLFLSLVLSFLPAPARTLVDHYTAAMRARADSSFVDYHAEMLAAHAVAPGHPVVQIHLARAAAALGATEEAAGWLERALRQGAWLDVREDPWLDVLLASDFGPALLRRADATGAHRGRATIGFELDDHDLMPEGIAHDPVDDAFYLSSTRERKIVRRTADGRVEDFVPPAGDGFLCGLGLEVDPGRRRLWAVAAADPALAAFDSTEVGRTGVWCWSLETGRLLGSRLAPSDGTDRAFNDLTLTPDGGAVVTDARAGTLFAVDAGLDRLRPLLADGDLRGPNGIVALPSENAVVVSEYAYGLTRVDLATGDRTPLRAAEGIALVGVDGLVLHEGDLLAVQNYAGLDRAARFELSDDGRRVVGCEVLEARHPRMDDPTTAVVAHGALWFIANSHIAGFDRDAPVPPVEEWTRPLVLRVELDPREP